MHRQVNKIKIFLLFLLHLMTLKRSLSHAFGMFLYATETLVKEVKKPLNCMRSPWLEAQAQLFKMGVM